MQSRAKITSTGQLSLPAEIRRRHGLSHGSEVLIEERGDEIVLRRAGDIVSRAQALSRELLAGRADAGVSEFLAERRENANRE